MSQIKDNYSAISFPEISGSICVGDSPGKFVLLGGKRSLHLVRLSDEEPGDDYVLQTTHKSFSTAVWKPHASDAFITASTKTVELWQESGGDFQVKSSFGGYSRNVCDMDWSSLNSNLLCISSHSPSSFILDTRNIRKHSCVIESVLPIYQTRWNQLKEEQVATCHGEVINLWDLRNLRQARLSYGLRSEHLNIHCIDWCPYSEHHLISSSPDGSLKLWDVNKQNDDFDNLFNFTNVSINSVKYTPLWRGIVAQCVSKASEELYLWNLSDDLSINQQLPAHSFLDSSNILQWFFRLLEGETQLVAWSLEQHLKFWNIAPYLAKSVTCAKTDVTPTRTSTHSSSSSSSSPTIKQDSHPSPHHKQPQSLMQEMEQLKLHLPHTILEKKSLEDRELRVLMELREHKVRLNMVMLDGYPSQAPLFSCLSGTNISKTDMRKLLDTLKQTCITGQCCIEACLRNTLQFLETLQGRRLQRGTEAKELSRDRLVGENIPFPRTSGARFCGPGFLVCFTRRVWVETNKEEEDEPERRKIQSESNMGTPRAMSALSEVASMHSKVINLARSLPATSHIPSISHFFEVKELHKDPKKEQRHKVRFKPHRAKSPKSYKRSLGPVIIYDLSCLLPIQKSLGENYVFDSNAVSMCRQNALVAQAACRKDLQEVWSLVALQLSESSRKHSDMPWSHTPFGKNLLDIWIEHYGKVKDVQTLAMLCCALMPAKLNKQQPIAAKDFELHKTCSIFVTTPNSTQSSQSTGRRKHSNSLSEPGSCHLIESKRKESIAVSPKPSLDDSLLPSSLTPRDCSNYIHAYSSILFQWGFIHQRVQLINAISQNDRDFVKNFAGFKKLESKCVLCRMDVPGLFVSCFDCGHGGHVRHLSAWFSNHQVCATGCGCHCLTYTNVSMT